MYVCTATKSFPIWTKFGVYLEVNEWYMTVCHMTRSKAKVMEVWKLQKWPISKFISSASMHVIKRLMVNYDTSRQYLNFNWTDFWCSSRWLYVFGCEIHFKLIPQRVQPFHGAIRAKYLVRSVPYHTSCRGRYRPNTHTMLGVPRR